MHDELRSRVARLSDEELRRRIPLLAGREREATVELVGHLAELDARGLHRAEGYGSLFAYCTGRLRLAEHAAYNRIEAARLSRKFPALLDHLADGSLNLSSVRLLGPHLRPDNFEALVSQARARNKREVEALVARVAPRPDVLTSVRKLPTRPTSAPRPSPTGPWAAALAGVVSCASGTTVAPEHAFPPAPTAPDSPGAAFVGGILAGDAPPAGNGAPPPERSSQRPVIAPLAPHRYRVQFTVGATTHDKLRRVQDLLRREVPDGDPGVIFDRALDLLYEEVSRRKLAQVSKPQPSRRSGIGSRHIPAHVKRGVWRREGGRCAFVTAGGLRCPERAFLEFHHRRPYALGGEATVANVSLRCRAHNQYEAELAFGRSGPARAAATTHDARERPSARAAPDLPLAKRWDSTAPRPEPNSPRGESKGASAR